MFPSHELGSYILMNALTLTYEPQLDFVFSLHCNSATCIIRFGTKSLAMSTYWLLEITGSFIGIKVTHWF